jgi:hypothetical protein
MAAISVRSYQPSDRASLRRICYDTGMMGEPASRYYGDFESFADMFTAYFTDFEPHNIVVAERQGRLVGYTCAALDAERQRSPERYLLRHVLLRGVCFKAGCRPFFLRALRDLLLEGSRKVPHVDHARYPSQMHINLLAEARHGGTATRMHCQLLDKLHERGSRGVFAEILANNQAVKQWSTRKLGYVLHGEPFLVTATRGPAGERLYNQIIVRSLEDWQPGTWRSRLDAAT